MMKTATVYSAIVDVLIDQPKAWTVAQLHQELVYRVFGIEVSEQNVRRAVALLPADCIERRHRRLYIRARGFAATRELVALIVREERGLNIPLLLTDDRRRQMRRELVLENNCALHASLRWAADGRFIEYEAGYRDMMVRAFSATY